MPRLFGLSSRLHFFAWWLAAIGFCLSALAAVWVGFIEERHDQADFHSHAKAQALAVDRGMDSAADMAEDLNQLFVSSKGKVSREQFASFTRAMRERYPFIETLAFQRLLAAEDRVQLEEKMRRTFPGFFIATLVDGQKVRAPLKDRYCFVDYREPFVGEDLPFGVDVLSLLYEDEALRRATDLGASASIGLASYSTADDPGQALRLLMAVYKDGQKPADISSRRKNVIGYTVIVLRPAELIRYALEDSQESLGHARFRMEVYASSAPDPTQLAYQTEAAPQDASLVTQKSWVDRGPAPFHYTFYMAGSAWHVVISAPATPFFLSHARAIVTLLVGILASGAFAVYVHAISLRTRRVEELVDERTEELRNVNEQLTEDIRARMQAEAALRESRSALRKLAAYQEKVREDERKRIARDIHDDLGQNLMALRMEVSRMETELGSLPAMKQPTHRTLTQIDTTIQAVRNIINDLRPAVLDLGLGTAIEWQANEFTKRTGIPCKIENGDPELELKDEFSTALFRIVQEALTNIARHAGASAASIAMKLENGILYLEVRDEGRGMPVENSQAGHGFGLVGIRERVRALGGVFTLISHPGRGTRLCISLPIENDSQVTASNPEITLSPDGNVALN